jgi:hypothetical protein
VGCHLGADRVVAHRQQPKAQAKRAGDLGGHLGEAGALGQSMATPQVGAQVEVAQRKPADVCPAVGLGVATQRPERSPGLPGQTPPGVRVDRTGQRVGDRVEVRAHQQTVELGVVGHVDDGGDPGGVGDLHHPRQ